jgi:hypothetical protein
MELIEKQRTVRFRITLRAPLSLVEAELCLVRHL